MSKEAKIGLLVSLGVILGFALVMQRQLGGTGHAPVSQQTEGCHIRYVDPSFSEPAPGSETADVAAIDEESTPTGLSSEAAGRDGEFVEDFSSVAEGPGSGAHDGYLVVGPTTTESVVEPTGTGETTRGAEERTGETVIDATPQPRYYVVKPGDSLYRIAEKEFGAGGGVRWKDILKLNPGLDTARLRPGMKIALPGTTPPAPAPREAEAATPRETTPATPREERRPEQSPRLPKTYVVKAGDTLGEISQREYGTSKKWQKIADANPKANPRALAVGQKLVIPVDESAPAPSADASGTLLAAALDEVRDFVHSGRGAMSSTETYKVRPGDTLYGISERTLGSGDRWKEIYELNKGRMSDPSALVAGKEILVPAAPRVAMADDGR